MRAQLSEFRNDQNPERWALHCVYILAGKALFYTCPSELGRVSWVQLGEE
jgi:hypothetical protein